MELKETSSNYYGYRVVTNMNLKVHMLPTIQAKHR